MLNKRVLDFLEFLKETNLNLKVLDKPSRDNRLRGDVLVDKLKQNDTLFVNKDGEEKQITALNNDDIIDNITNRSGKYDPKSAEEFFKQSNRYLDVIDGEDINGDDDDYKLNDLEKTAEFGSSPGSSLGTTKTRIVESIQCMYLSLRQEKEVTLLRNSFYNEIISQQTTGRVRIPIEITQDVLDSFFSDWWITWIKTANSLYSVRNIPSVGRVDSILNPRTIYKLYHVGFRSGLISVINRKYKQFEPSLNISKWCPADIWAVNLEREERIARTINTSNSIVELNQKIDNLFDKKLLVGISLKKLTSTDEVPDIIINKETPIPTYKFDSIKLSKDPFTSIGLMVISRRFSEAYGQGLEQLKIGSSSGPDEIGNINFEVIGKTARHGKIALSRINEILHNLNVEEIETASELSNVSDRELTRRIKELNELIINEYGSNESDRTQTTRSRVRMISKYQSLLFAKLLYDYEDEPSDEIDGYSISDVIVQKILYFAMSISNDRFVCPKYARFI
jgi:hypothetical protein